MLVRPVMKRLFYLGKPRRKRLASLARLMITYPPAVPKIIQDERQSGETPLVLATCTFPPWSTVAQTNTFFGLKSLPTNSDVRGKGLRNWRKLRETGIGVILRLLRNASKNMKRK